MKTLIVLKERVKSRRKYIYSHLYLCYCGKEFVAEANQIKSGHTSSCGCYGKQRRAETNTRHGKHNSRVYSSWENMIQRCTNPNSTGYEYYGGRGITVCDSWKIFDNFLKDMGERPENMSLDRIDCNGNYEPANCRWATGAMQLANRRPRSCYKKP